jgi:hypothetical protein
VGPRSAQRLAAGSRQCRRLDRAVADLVTAIVAAPRVDYLRRRKALAQWTLPAADWDHVARRLQKTGDPQHRRHIRWDDRKRRTASALIWLRVTHGEHRFAPQRRSPGARPGSTAGQGLSIDRAWWRLRVGHPGEHYWELDRALAPYAARLADLVDRSGQGPLRPDPTISVGPDAFPPSS